MCTLSLRVHTGVGSAGSVQANPLTADALQCALEMILNGIAVRLTLPTGKRSSVVGDDELKPLRHCLRLAFQGRIPMPGLDRDNLARLFVLPLGRYRPETGVFSFRSPATRAGRQQWLIFHPRSPLGTTKLPEAF